MAGRRQHPAADPAATLPTPSLAPRSSSSPASRAAPHTRDGVLGTATAPGQQQQHRHEQYPQQYRFYRDEGASAPALGAPPYAQSHVATAAEGDEEVYARNRHHFERSRVHPGSSASEYWEHHRHQTHASPARGRVSVHALPLPLPPSRQLQLQLHESQSQSQLEEDVHDASLHYYPQRNSYPPPSHCHYRPTRSQTQHHHQQLHRSSSYDNVERELVHPQHRSLAMHRSFIGKRKADEQNDTSLAFVGYTASRVENVHLTSPPPTARDDATVFYPDTYTRSSPSRQQQQQQENQHVERYAAPAPTERASQHQRHRRQQHDYEQQLHDSQSIRSHGAYPGSDPSLPAPLRPAWLPRLSGEASHSDNDSGDGEDEDESKPSGLQRSAPLSRTAPLAPPIQSMAQVSVSRRSDAAATERAAAPSSPPLALPPHGRVITNASRNITFAMLQPHFERPLQEAALNFGVCTTLLKKICRKNGIKNWPFRRICGLHKSIASMEKQVHYFDGEQKRSYADQLYKLQLELEAFKRTGNAPTPAFIAKIEAEGGVVPSDSRSSSRRLDRLSESDALLSLRGGSYAETKTEDPALAYRAHHRHGHADSSGSDSYDRRCAVGLSPPALCAVSTRVSVSSYSYASSASPNQADDERAQQYPYCTPPLQQYTHAVGTHHVMASTVDLGCDSDDRDERTSSQHRHSAARHRQREVQQQHALPQRALPSLSFMLHRQSQPAPSQGVGAAERAPRAPPPHADGSAAYTSPNQHQEHHF